MQIIEDKELGRLVIRVNPQARRFVFRTKSDAIYVSVPPGTTRKDLDAAIEDLRDKLADSRQRVEAPRLINWNYRIDTELFQLKVIQGNQPKLWADYQSGVMNVICPPGTNFSDVYLQQWIRKTIEAGLRRCAKCTLPERLRQLAGETGLLYNEVKISASKGRWGSCSSRKSINLSFYLVLLPQHLIDYVLLHELCHTREMNHSDKFWELMNQVTDGKAWELREELRGFKTDIE